MMKNNPPLTPRFQRPLYNLLLILMFLLALPGCKRGTPAAQPTSAPGLPAVTVPAAVTTNPLVLTATPPAPGAGPAQSGTPVAMAAPSPTAGAGTPATCTFPSGWVVYTILPGDTLSGLAASIGSSVEEIQRGNCKEDDRLVAYETLHLPRRPPVHGAAGSGATEERVAIAATEDPCASIFSCTNPGLPSYGPVGASGGGDGPCDDGLTGPRVNYKLHKDDIADNTVRIGKSTYFFACGFDHPENLKAWVTGRTGTEDLTVQEGKIFYFSRISQITAGERVLIWYPVCNLPEGSYTIYVSDRQQTGSVTMNLIKAESETIMVKPMLLKAGTKFDIYYCGYPANASIKIDLIFSKVTFPLGQWEFTPLKSFDVTMNNAGWYEQKQTVPPGTPANEYDPKLGEAQEHYMLVNHADAQSVIDGFWVIPSVSEDFWIVP